MSSPVQIAEKFTLVDVHDDTVENVLFIPQVGRRLPRVEVTLHRHWKGQRRLVTFGGCANYQTVIDADVLDDNAPNNTCSFEASTNPEEIEELIRGHRKSWNVSYAKSLDPMPSKLSAANHLVLFRVLFFGGTLLILAKSFTVKRLTLPSRGLAPAAPSRASHVKR